MNYSDQQIVDFLRARGVVTDLARLRSGLDESAQAGWDEHLYAVRNYCRQHGVAHADIDRALQWPPGSFLAWLAAHIVCGMGDMTNKPERTDAEVRAEYAHQPELYAWAYPHRAFAHASARRWTVRQFEAVVGLLPGTLSAWMAGVGLTWEAPAS